MIPLDVSYDEDLLGVFIVGLVLFLRLGREPTYARPRRAGHKALN